MPSGREELLELIDFCETMQALFYIYRSIYIYYSAHGAQQDNDIS
jgi:hypothetical protein